MRLRTVVMQLWERVESLDRLMEAKFTAFRTLIDLEAENVKLALNASREAINKADKADEKARDRLADDMTQRFASVNEFRGALEDSQAENVRRSEFEEFRNAYTERHAALRGHYDTQLSALRDHYDIQLAEMKTRLDKTEGRTGGIVVVWGVLVAVAGIVIAIAALVYAN